MVLFKILLTCNIHETVTSLVESNQSLYVRSFEIHKLFCWCFLNWPSLVNFVSYWFLSICCWEFLRDLRLLLSRSWVYKPCPRFILLLGLSCCCSDPEYWRPGIWRRGRSWGRSRTATWTSNWVRRWGGCWERGFPEGIPSCWSFHTNEGSVTSLRPVLVQTLTSWWGRRMFSSSVFLWEKNGWYWMKRHRMQKKNGNIEKHPLLFDVKDPSFFDVPIFDNVIHIVLHSMFLNTVEAV